MSRVALLLILVSAASTLSWGAGLVQLEGVVSSVESQNGKKVVHFRTATQDIDLNFDSLSPDMKATVGNYNSHIRIFKLPVNSSQILSQKDVPLGARPDCTELPISVPDLESIVTKSKVTDQQSFLNAIPAGTLQGFTFVYNTLSLQRGTGVGKVNPMWPRVLRASVDGKTTISYVCDPRNQNYGLVEVVYFDDAKQRIQTAEWNFKGAKPFIDRQGSYNWDPMHKDRIHKGKTDCMSCHSGSVIQGQPTVKFNWPEYFFWSDCDRTRGISMYGSSDDNMGPNSFRERADPGGLKTPKGCKDGTKDLVAHKAEIADYQKFRDLQKGNPCYNSLPWVNPSPAQDPDGKLKQEYKYYPYAETSAQMTNGKFNYALRTNLRFTDTYAHWTAKQLASLIKKDKADYDVAKYYVVMEAASCTLNPDDREKLKRLLNLPDRSPPIGSISGEDPKSTPILYNLGKKAGLQDHDWTLEFHLENDSQYRAAIANDGGFNDLQVKDIVAGEVLKDIASSDPAVAAVAGSALTRGVTKQFGDNFSCIDDIGGGIKDTEANPTAYGEPFTAPGTTPTEGRLCDTLRAQNDKHIAAALAARAAMDASCHVDEQSAVKLRALAGTTSKMMKKLDEASIIRGRDLVQPGSKGKCVMCHSARVDSGLPPDFRFIPDRKAGKDRYAESMAVLQARVQEGFLQKLDDRLVKTQTMPPFQNQLNSQDRLDIEAYVESLVSKSP